MKTILLAVLAAAMSVAAGVPLPPPLVAHPK
jgi:hypothetical protein